MRTRGQRGPRTHPLGVGTRRLALEGLETRDLLSADVVSAGDLSALWQAQNPLGSLIYTQSLEDVIEADTTDEFTFGIQAGQVLTVVVEARGNIRPEVNLIDPNNVPIRVPATGQRANRALLSAQTITDPDIYTLQVAGSDSMSGPYRLQLILNAALEEELFQGTNNNHITRAQQLDNNLITLGGQRTAILGTVGDTFTSLDAMDHCRWNLEQGKIASLALTTTLSPRELTLEVLDRTGKLLARGSSAGNVDRVIHDFMAPATDDYFVRVASNDLSTGYSLVIITETGYENEPNNTRAQAEPLSLSGAVAGRIAAPSPLPAIDEETEPNDDGIAGGSIDDLAWANDLTSSFVRTGHNSFAAVVKGEISGGSDEDWDFCNTSAI